MPMARVLLAAEEEATTSRVARLALEAAGHDVREVYDGQTALAEIDAQHPDVAVLDTSLPILDGFQVLDRLRRQPAYRHLPVVMLSTISKSLGGELARSLGAARFVAKPFTATHLTEAIDTAMTPRPAAGGPPAPAVPRPPSDWRARLRRSIAAPSTDGAGVVELPVPPRRRIRAPRRRSRNA
jgi:CheY-like chemotaxis protein